MAHFRKKAREMVNGHDAALERALGVTQFGQVAGDYIGIERLAAKALKFFAVGSPATGGLVSPGMGGMLPGFGCVLGGHGYSPSSINNSRQA